MLRYLFVGCFSCLLFVVIKMQFEMKSRTKSTWMFVTRRLLCIWSNSTQKLKIINQQFFRVNPRDTFQSAIGWAHNQIYIQCTCYARMYRHIVIHTHTHSHTYIAKPIICAANKIEQHDDGSSLKSSRSNGNYLRVAHYTFEFHSVCGGTHEEQTQKMKERKKRTCKIQSNGGNWRFPWWQTVAAAFCNRQQDI